MAVTNLRTCDICFSTNVSYWYTQLPDEPRGCGNICNKCYMRNYHQKRYAQPGAKEKEALRVKNYRLKNLERYKKLERKRAQKPPYRFKNAKGRAKLRSKEWLLTLEEYTDIISRPCYYCSNKLGEPVILGCGLDRIDNHIGYKINNVVSCCYFCNSIKGENLSSEEMKKVAVLLIKLRASACAR